MNADAVSETQHGISFRRKRAERNHEESLCRIRPGISYGLIRTGNHRCFDD